MIFDANTMKSNVFPVRLRLCLAVICTTGFLCPLVTARAQGEAPLQQQRLAIIEANKKGDGGLPVVVAAMASPHAMIRRLAVRLMDGKSQRVENVLLEAFQKDSDPLVRRIAIQKLAGLNRQDTLNLLATALDDSSELVRIVAVQELMALPNNPQADALLDKAKQDTSPQVSQLASQARWAFHNDGVSLREKPGYKDNQLNILQTIALPLDNWKFQKDPNQDGHDKNWFAVDYQDKDWTAISIRSAWEEQLGHGYDGVAWYRNSFTLPAKPVQEGTDIVFEGVDESAWIWVNGHFIGRHDIGTDGWDKQFAMDVSDVLKWGDTNQITVRVLDRRLAGGIWKPVYLEVLKR